MSYLNKASDYCTQSAEQAKTSQSSSISPTTETQNPKNGTHTSAKGSVSIPEDTTLSQVYNILFSRWNVKYVLG